MILLSVVSESGSHFNSFEMQLQLISDHVSKECLVETDIQSLMHSNSISC